MSSGRKVLIAVDESVCPLKWALENIVRSHDKLHVLHVQPYPKIYDEDAQSARFYEPPLLVETTEKHDENVSRGIAHSVKAMCEHFMITPEIEIVEGEAGRVICDTAERIHAAFVIVGSHRHGAIKKAFLGSVSDYCVHHCHRPVIVIRMPIPEAPSQQQHHH